MSLLCFILAGGKSTRMGQDKALIHDSVNTLSRKLEKKGCIVVVACGSNERANLFNSNCWPDPDGTESLADTIRLFVEEKQEQTREAEENHDNPGSLAMTEPSRKRRARNPIQHTAESSQVSYGDLVQIFRGCQGPQDEKT